MKLKIYNSENSKNTHSGKATIRIARKSGLFSLSKTAGEKMGLVRNDRVIIVEDEENPGNFYLHKTSDPSGFALRFKTENSGLSWNCSKLANIILASKLIKSVSYTVGNAQEIDGMPYHLIITAKPLGEISK